MSDFTIYVKSNMLAIYQDERLMMEVDVERPTLAYTIAEIICEANGVEVVPVTPVLDEVEFTDDLSLVETQILGFSFDGS